MTRRFSRPEALDYVAYRRYVTARTLWALASQMLAIAVAFQVYSISRDPLDLGLIGLAVFLPFVVLTLPAGHIADTYDRQRVLVVCYGLLTLCAVALIVITLIGPPDPRPIIALMILYGAARAIALPAAQAMVPNLVPPAVLPNAVAFNSTTYQTATIIGPAIGGVLLVFGAGFAYGAAALCLLAATLLMTRVHVLGPATDRPRGALTVASLMSGIQFVRRQPMVLGAISLDMFAVLFGGAVALLPIYALDILHVGPTGLGIMRAAPAVGAVVMAVTLGALPLRRRVGRWLFVSVAIFGMATVVFALSRSFPLTLAALVVMGSVDMISVYIRNLVVQLATPDAIRGRVSAVNGVFVGASNELGEFESGTTAALWGPVTAVLVGGLATIAVAASWAVLFPMLRTMDRFPDPAAVPGADVAAAEASERGV